MATLILPCAGNSSRYTETIPKFLLKIFKYQDAFVESLAGLGDLILTCSSMQSRNFSLGVEIGKGKSLEDILKERKTVSEGVYTAKAVKETAVTTIRKIAAIFKNSFFIVGYFLIKRCRLTYMCIVR